MQYIRDNHFVFFVIIFLVVFWGRHFLILKNEKHWVRVKVTIPEGYNISDITNAFASKLPHFNGVKFLLDTKNREGYLFPDTYVFGSTDNEEDVERIMNDNFQKKITSIRPEIISSGQSEKEIIIMASLIEKEAKGSIDRGFISGILWKRLALDIPLQVDSAPETYQVKGLPDSPISNPGMEALKAAIHPESSVYLFYLHDKNGTIHYAKNFTEHQANKLKYLK